MWRPAFFTRQWNSEEKRSLRVTRQEDDVDEGDEKEGLLSASRDTHNEQEVDYIKGSGYSIQRQPGLDRRSVFKTPSSSTWYAKGALIAIMLFGTAGAALVVYGLFATSGVVGQTNVTTQQQARNITGNLSACPGYTLTSLKNNAHGLTAQLSLAGTACNALGLDIHDLTIEVTYETQTRLHVHIFDTAQLQFQIPPSVIARPAPPTKSLTKSSDLVFNYESKPFAFWITRRDDPQGEPLFDTRPASLPSRLPVQMDVGGENRDAVSLENMGLVFEDQYLQLASSLPNNANVYGLGEVVAGSGFRRDVAANGTIQTLWTRDIADPVDENVYGSHPIYLEHRFNPTTKTSSAHGVFLLSSQGADILLLTPPESSFASSTAQKSLIEYRMLGGTLDFYFLSGPAPISVVEQYGELVGTQSWVPAWAFGFHLCRWGYKNISETREVVRRMRAAGIPLETMWNDIDLYHAVRDFTTDPVSFPPDEVKAFIEELTANHQHYIPIVDAAIAKQVNATDIYDPYTRGAELDVFIKNPDGSEYVGQVWPGFTVFPDWFANNTQTYWSEAFANWSRTVNFSGIWLDMNEASSFCDGSCGSGIDISNTSVPFLLPGVPGNPVSDYPEGYNAAVWGPSGNITINGTLTFDNDPNASSLTARAAFDTGSTTFASRSGPRGTRRATDVAKARKGLGAANLVASGADINHPPYTIHNGFGNLSIHALATNATHAGGFLELDVHNMWGLMEEKATHQALLSLHPNVRPFLISRSTFPSSGKYTGHWLGDNFSKWSYMHYAIQGVLQFQLFQIPMVGSDTGGFNGNADEELVGRWMQLSAFHPFYRNHNIMGAISQEPYVWDSVANASRIAIEARYRLLPYWYTLFANTSLRGTPPVRALFWEFPDEPDLFGIDAQFLVGKDILVSPVLQPNVSSVKAIFPGSSKNTTWRSFFTHALQQTSDGTATVPAPLGTIPVHIRSGAALLLHAEPAYTIEETRAGPYEVLVSLDKDGSAWGDAYVDDGISFPPGPSARLVITAGKNGKTGGRVDVKKSGKFSIGQQVTRVTILGVSKKPGQVSVSVGGKKVASPKVSFDAEKEEVVVELGKGVSLQSGLGIEWA